MVTLIQTKKVKRVPIVLLGKDYWTPYTDLFRTHLYEKYHTIDKEDLDIYHLVDSVDEAYALITKLVPITGQRSIRQEPAPPPPPPRARPACSPPPTFF